MRRSADNGASFQPIGERPSYRALIWLTYRLAATFALGLPLVLLAWAAIRREAPCSGC